MIRAIDRVIYFKGVFFFSILFVCAGHGIKAQVAPGVQQPAAQTATITGEVVQDNGTPVADANVRLIGPAIVETKTDVHGTFDFMSVPYGIYRIDVTAVNLGTTSQENLSVKGDITVAIQYAAQNAGGLKTIAHVSTLSAGSRINVTAASIASVNPSAYAFEGNTSWQHLLEQIPGVAVAGGLRSGISCAVAIPGNPIQPTILSINGALPYETSVTLDGMPIENSAPVNDLYIGGEPGGGADISFLPLPAFETADVVRGPGANAPSIVDSIGGSLVLHAPGIVDHNQFEFSTSTDPYGGIVVNTKAAVRLGKFSATVIYGVNDSPGPLHGNFITASDSADILAINGNPTENTGNIGYISNPRFPNCLCINQSDLLFCCIPYSTAWTQHGGAISLSYNPSSSVSAQVFYAGSSSEMAVPNPGEVVDFTPAAGYAGSLAPGSYVYPALQEQGPIQKTESLLEERVTASFGNGVIRLAALQNNSYYNISFPNVLAPDGQYTVYGTAFYTSAPGTPVNFNGTAAQIAFCPYSSASQFWTNNRDLLGSYATQLGTSSQAGISFVSSYYNAPYDCNAMFFGFPISSSRPSAVSEQTDEFRLNFGTQLSERVSFDASWYFARGTYHVLNPNDASQSTYVDSTFPYNGPRFSGVWRPNNDVAIRAAAGGGYALPPINYLTSPNTLPNCVSGVVCVATSTNLNLKPESSFGFDLGTDIRLRRDTVLAVDLYQTNLYGQFFQSANLSGTCPTCGGLPLYTTQYQNLSQSRFEGINLDLHHQPARGIYWSAALGLTRGYVISVPAGFYNGSCGMNCVNTYLVPGINFDGANQATVPYANGTAQVGYRWSPEKYVDISPTYFGNNNAYFQPAFIVVNADASYPLARNVTLLAIFRNITGIYDQNYQVISPTFEAPQESLASPNNLTFFPEALYGVPYGPRTVTLTADFKF